MPRTNSPRRKKRVRPNAAQKNAKRQIAALQNRVELGILRSGARANPKAIGFSIVQGIEKGSYNREYALRELHKHCRGREGFKATMVAGIRRYITRYA